MANPFDGDAFGKELSQLVREFVLREIGKLDLRIARLEARPEIVDRGIWCEGAYKTGSVVTFNGSLWIAQNDTDARPGTNAEWRLAVKRGRDGKDAR